MVLALIYLLSSRFSYFADVVFQTSYVIFEKPTFDYVLPDYVPTDAEIINGDEGLFVMSAQGEIEPVTFSVRANQDLGNIDLTVSDLTFGDSIISQENIEILNIKTWDQCKYKPDSSDCRYGGGHTVEATPELLVKDNEQDLVAEDTGWDAENQLYTPPTINDVFNLELPSDVSHTFYIRIKTPENIEAGSYLGKINFSPELAEAREIDLEFKVLPYVLPADGKDRLIYFQQKSIGENGFHNSEFYMEHDLYKKYLAKIKEAGYNGVVIYQTAWAEIRSTINYLSRKEFSGPIVFANVPTDWVEFMNQDAISKGLDPYFYGIDEPNINTADEPKTKNHINAVKSLHDKGSKVFTAIRTECVEATDDPEFYLYGLEGVAPATQKTDLPNYAFMIPGFDCANEFAEHDGKERLSFIEYTSGLWDKTIKKRRDREYYYHQSWEERGAFNRIVFGLVTHRLGLDGTAPYAVTGHFENRKGNIWHGTSFYDDFDGPKKEHNTLYPGADGPVLTFQWESAREGIDDSRYLTKADMVLKEVEDKFGREHTRVYRDVIKTILEKYHFTGYEGSNPWKSSVSSKMIDDSRSQIINLIAEMQNLLTNTVSPELLNINISENQVITTNPYLITAKATDDIKVEKVEFYVDNNLIGTSTLPDVEGNFQATWDTSKYHSTVRVVAYDLNQNQTEAEVNATVQLAQDDSDQIVVVLPKTGKESWKKETAKELKTYVNQVIDIIR